MLGVWNHNGRTLCKGVHGLLQRSSSFSKVICYMKPVKPNHFRVRSPSSIQLRFVSSRTPRRLESDAVYEKLYMEQKSVGRVLKDTILYSAPIDVRRKFAPIGGVILILMVCEYCKSLYELTIASRDRKRFERMTELNKKYCLFLMKHYISVPVIITGFGLAWLTFTLFPMSLRIVTRLTLLKGGKRLAIQTYAPATTREFIVPLREVTFIKGRPVDNKRSWAKFSVRGSAFYYHMERTGSYFKTDIFDKHVALRRHVTLREKYLGPVSALLEKIWEKIRNILRMFIK